MVPNGISLIILVCLILAVILLLRWVWRRPQTDQAVPAVEVDGGESLVTPRILMTPEEATLYNLIKLAAQDHRLIFAKMPLLQVLSFVDKDEEARKTVMRKVQSVRCDVVLAHPGTLTTTTVITFPKDSPDANGRSDRDRLVQTLLQAAGIESVILHAGQMYSVEQLTALLGFAEDD